MKRLYILFLFCVSVSWSQQVRTQKDILELPNTDLVKDFNLSSKNAIPVKVVEAKYTDTGFPFLKKSFSYNKERFTIETYSFKNKKLVKKVKENFYEDGYFLKDQKITFNYIYDSNGKLIEEWSPKLKSGGSQKTFYSYKDSFISKILETGVLGNGTKFSKSKIFTKTGNLLSSDYNNVKTDFKLENNLIKNVTTKTKSSITTHTFSTDYTYNKKGFIIKSGASNISLATFQLNNKNLIVKQESDPFVTYYKYVYDKHGNWIIKYPLSYYENKFYDKESSLSIREIRYSNGEITGGITPEHKNIKRSLLKARKDLYHSIVTNNVTWLKTTGDRYAFYVANENVTHQVNSTIVGKDLFVFYRKTKEVFICENFANKELDKEFKAKKVSLKTNNGYWFKHKNGGVFVWNNIGDPIFEKSLFQYASNGIDVIYQAKGKSKKVLLKNYKNAVPYKIYSAELYTDTSTKKKNITVVKNTTKKFNIFDETTTKLILSKGNNDSAIVEILNKSIEEKIKLQPDNKTQIITEHLHSLFTLNPNVLFHTVMGLKYYDNQAIKNLPKHIRDYMSGTAKEGLNQYNKKTKN